MKIMKEADERFVNIEKKIGMFIIIALIGMAAGIAFIGIQQDVFTPKTEIFFVADSGRDITEGQAVKLSGFKIGKVKKLSLDDIARVKVELSINKKYMKWIKSDSKARLTKEGLIGESIIEITPGSLHAKQITENGIIVFEREKGLTEMAEELKNEIKPVLLDIKQIVHYVNDPQSNFKQTLRNLEKVSGDLSATRQYLDSLVQNTEKNLSVAIQNTDKNLTTAMVKVNSILDSSKQTIENTDNVIKRFDKDMPNLLRMVNKSLENVQKATDEIKKATEQASPQIPSLLEKGNDVADSAREVIDSVKQVWPISLYIEVPENKILKIDSYE
ncbi:MAG: MCE family protein [Nitrospira sp.]|nr:MCE family protein [Nitrospira sp.]